MKKLAIPLSALAVAALGACALYEPDRPAMQLAGTNIASQPIAYHTGMGTIAKITASPSYVVTTAAPPAPVAAAGSTVIVPSVPAGYPFNRLMVRMDNGAMQYIDTDSNQFRSGMRVELLPDRTIRPLDGPATTIR